MTRFTALFLAAAVAFAQDPAPRPGPATPATGAVIRIDVNLVQVDAVVTDARDRRVADLQPSAFEILQDGKLQTITNFTYVSRKPGDEAPVVDRAASLKPAKGEPPPPPTALRPTEVRRTVALIVDDLGLSAESLPGVRAAIRNFIDDQMRPGDLAAIVRTSAGMGALQQFTTDKRLLHAALDHVKYVDNRVGVSSFAPLGRAPRGDRAINQLREESFTVGSLGAIRFVVNAMRGSPGRKSVILFTENIRMVTPGSTDDMVEHAVQLLSDAASRASVVIHAIDPRGMPDFNLTPADDTAGVSRRRVRQLPAQRQAEEVNTQQGMFELAQKTGGLFLHDTNDLNAALKKAAEDSDGYYLIGYHPDTGTFESANGQPRFHRIEVKVKTAGLHVRSRDGFFGEPGNGIQPLDHTREAELTHALQSPFATAPIHPRLTAVFSNAPAGSFINAMLFFNPAELKWSTEPDGSRKASVDLAAAAFDENGLTLAPVDTTSSLQLSAAKFDDAMKKGMVYTIHVPVSRPGSYLVRAALRDPATEGTGSAQQYVEVPDVASGHLALSGIVLQESVPEQSAAATEAATGPAPTEDASGGAARRSFRRGTSLLYAYEIINAQPGEKKEGAGPHPELEIETRMFHDGKQVLDGRSMLPGTSTPADPRRVTAGGRLTLGREMTAGEYVLQIIVTDKLAKGKFATATQSMDFEIEP